LEYQRYVGVLLTRKTRVADDVFLRSSLLVLPRDRESFAVCDRGISQPLIPCERYFSRRSVLSRWPGQAKTSEITLARPVDLPNSFLRVRDGITP